MILQYSYILIIIFRIKEMQERKQGNDGHLQHVMATLVIIYNLCFFFDVSYWFVLILRDGGGHRSEKKASATLTIKQLWATTASTFVASDCRRNSCKTWFLHPVCPLPTQSPPTFTCSATWSQIVVQRGNRTLRPAAVQWCSCTWLFPSDRFASTQQQSDISSIFTHPVWKI